MKWHLLHDWSDWEDDKAVELKATEHRMSLGTLVQRTDGYMLIQKRRCRLCKRVQLSNIKTK